MCDRSRPVQQDVSRSESYCKTQSTNSLASLLENLHNISFSGSSNSPMNKDGRAQNTIARQRVSWCDTLSSNNCSEESSSYNGFDRAAKSPKSVGNLVEGLHRTHATNSTSSGTSNATQDAKNAEKIEKITLVATKSYDGPQQQRNTNDTKKKVPLSSSRSQVSPNNINGENTSSNSVNSTPIRVLDLPWIDYRGVAGKYTGEVNNLIQPHGCGVLIFNDGTRAKSSGWCYGTNVTKSSEETKSLSKRTLENKFNNRALGGKALIQRESVEEVENKLSQKKVKGDRFSVNLNYKMENTSSMCTELPPPSPTSSNSTMESSSYASPSFEAFHASSSSISSCSNCSCNCCPAMVSLPGFSLGDEGKPHDMIEEVCAKNAIQSVGGLKVHDFAFGEFSWDDSIALLCVSFFIFVLHYFSHICILRSLFTLLLHLIVLRSNGSWTYAIVADRPNHSVSAGDNIRFVLDRQGYTKTIGKKYWAKGIRLANFAAYKNKNACAMHSSNYDENQNIHEQLASHATDSAMEEHTNFKSRKYRPSSSSAKSKNSFNNSYKRENSLGSHYLESLDEDKETSHSSRRYSECSFRTATAPQHLPVE